MVYEIEVTETLSVVKEVEASSLIEAIAMVEEQYYKEEIVLGAEEMKGVEFTFFEVKQIETLTMGSLFDGIGGFPLAALQNGITPVWASEVEPFPMEVTKYQFPDMLHVGDITKLNGATLPPVDIITGGSPCQDLSLAGTRAGLAGKRSGLFMEQVRITKEMRAEDARRNKTTYPSRPRFFIWENVPGAFSSAEGEDFKAVLEETLRIVSGDLSIPRPAGGTWQPSGAILGEEFSLAWRVFNARYWGVPQRRYRIFLVADFGGQTAPKILFEQDRLLGNIATNGEEQTRATSILSSSIGHTRGVLLYYYR